MSYYPAGASAYTRAKAKYAVDEDIDEGPKTHKPIPEDFFKPVVINWADDVDDEETDYFDTQSLPPISKERSQSWTGPSAVNKPPPVAGSSRSSIPSTSTLRPPPPARTPINSTVQQTRPVRTAWRILAEKAAAHDVSLLPVEQKPLGTAWPALGNQSPLPVKTAPSRTSPPGPPSPPPPRTLLPYPPSPPPARPILRRPPSPQSPPNPVQSSYPPAASSSSPSVYPRAPHAVTMPVFPMSPIPHNFPPAMRPETPSTMSPPTPDETEFWGPTVPTGQRRASVEEQYSAYWGPYVPTHQRRASIESIGPSQYTADGRPILPPRLKGAFEERKAAAGPPRTRQRFTPSTAPNDVFAQQYLHSHAVGPSGPPPHRTPEYGAQEWNNAPMNMGPSLQEYLPDDVSDLSLSPKSSSRSAARRLRRGPPRLRDLDVRPTPRQAKRDVFMQQKAMRGRPVQGGHPLPVADDDMHTRHMRVMSLPGTGPTQPDPRGSGSPCQYWWVTDKCPDANCTFQHQVPDSHSLPQPPSQDRPSATRTTSFPTASTSRAPVIHDDLRSVQPAPRLHHGDRHTAPRIPEGLPLPPDTLEMLNALENPGDYYHSDQSGEESEYEEDYEGASDSSESVIIII